MKTTRNLTRLCLLGALLIGLAAPAATITWTNSGSGGWNTAANWNPNAVPGTNDTAVIANPGVTVTLNSATGVGGIILGTSGGSTVTLLLNNQTLALYGPLTVNSSGSFTVDGGSLLGTNAVLSGTIGWSAGSLGGILTLASGSTLNITTANNHFIGGCILTNSGTVNWSGGQLLAGGGAVFYNYGLWNAQDDQQLNNYSGGAGTVFNNFGTFRKSAGINTSYTLIGNPVTFNNTGVVDVQHGVLMLQGDDSFTGGYITTNSTGTTYFSYGDFILNGTATGTNVIESANANLVGTVVINGALNWQGGSWNNTVVTVPASSVLNITTVNNHSIGGCILTNFGTVNWSDGQLLAGGGAVFYNYGLWNAQNDQNLTDYSGGAGTVFNNFGTFRKSAGINTSYTLIGNPVTFNNTGVVDVQHGVLMLQGDDSFTGGYITTNSTGTTYFSYGDFILNGTATGTNVIESANANLVGTVVINGALNWQGGSWNNTVVTVPASSVLNITTVNNHSIGGCILTNFGTVNWSDGQLLAGGGAVFYNYGLWNAQNDQNLTDYSGGAGTVFNNFGTFRKSGGISASGTLIGNPVTFNNTGVVDVQHGVLMLQGDDSFTGGYITTNSTGKTYFSYGDFILNGTATGTNVIESANANLVGTVVINGALNWQGGSWNNTVVTVPASSVLNITTVNNHSIGGCILTNFGTVNWSDGQLLAGGGAVFYNYGLWNAQNDQTLNDYYGSPSTTVFNNFGIFRKSGGTTASGTLLGNPVTFNNTGIVDVQQGNLTLQGNDSLTGGYLSTNSPGKTYLSSGNFNINGTVTGNNVIESGGNLVGTNVINGALTWQNGLWHGTVVTVASNSVVNITTANNHDVGGCLVTNFGTVNWSDGQLLAGGGAVFYNYGLWNAQNDQTLNDYYGSPNTTVFNNFGTLRKSGATGNTTLASGVTFNNAGKIDAQDGNIALQGSNTLANGTQMGFGLGGSAGNGSITLSGPASFAGSASVNLRGFFWPAAGSVYNLLNYTSESGLLFTNFTLPGIGYLTWQTNYNATAFVLSVLAHTATNTTRTNLFISKLNSGNVILQWPGDHTGWSVQAQTNPITAGLGSNWADLAGASLTNQFVMPINQTNATVFFRMVLP